MLIVSIIRLAALSMPTVVAKDLPGRARTGSAPASPAMRGPMYSLAGHRSQLGSSDGV